ncbi:hypothetical protein FXO38_05039 [Capsicum annuum]|nr:hypothetical protein FXO38_05039 [Capsicum annuum]
MYPYLMPMICEIKQQYKKKFKAFTDKTNDAFIDVLKTHLHNVIVITSSKDVKDGYDNQDLGVQVQSQHSLARAVRDDDDIKEVLLKIEFLEQASINVDEMMIPDEPSAVGRTITIKSRRKKKKRIKKLIVKKKHSQ